MNVTRETKQGVVILRLQGKMMGGPSDSKALGEPVDDAIASRNPQILVDLGGLSLVNSTGLGVLLTNHTRVEKADGRLKLVNIPRRIGASLQMTWLNRVFDLYESESEALDSFDDAA